MKILKSLLFTGLVACTLVLSACGNKNASQEKQSTDKNEKMMEMLMKAGGASDEENAHVKCMMDLTEKMRALQKRLSREQLLALRDQFELIEESLVECKKGLGMLNEFEIEINAKEQVEPVKPVEEVTK